MKSFLGMCAGVGVALAIAGAARADWNPGDPAKWVQLPDLTPTGMDVLDTAVPTGVSKILADDWLCQSIDPVTDINIWGSWLNDQVPVRHLAAGDVFDPGYVTFKLSIHSDVPANGTVPSHPGALLWQTVTTPTAVRLYSALLDPQHELFYNPNINQIIGTDHMVWQYNFTNLPDPFIQQGTPDKPVIYWMDVQALPADGQQSVLFGWKTALPPHQLDDAVFGDTPYFAGPLIPGGIAGSGWTDMHYPDGTQYFPQSLDLSFVITTPEPGTLAGMALGGLLLLARRRKN